MFYEIKNHALARVAVIAAKRALRETEDNLREHEKHARAQQTTQPPKTVVLDNGFAVTLDHKSVSEWEYVIGEVVTGDA